MSEGDKHGPRILYGVTTDGNGHIARASTLIPELEKRGAHITTLFSGSTLLTSYDRNIFKDVEHRQGYQRSADDGKVDIGDTILQNILGLPVLTYEVLTMDLRPYDVIISDFEPVTSWSSRFHNLISSKQKTSIGLAHQYAFERNVPKAPGFLMNNAHSLARAKTRLGMHFNHFEQEGILPPFIADDIEPTEPEKGKILVYLGFDDLKKITEFLEQQKNYNFHVYSKQATERIQQGHITINPLSRERFQKDFSNCEGIITGAGFMAPSEALHMGKKMLLRPMPGHPEQHSNALALKMLGAAHIMLDLDAKELKDFLEDEDFVQIKYPNVAQSLADWIMKGNYSKHSANELCDELWDQTEFFDEPHHHS